MWDNPCWSELWKDWPDLFLSESNMWFCLVSSISPCPTFLPHVYLVAMKSDIDFAFAIKGNTLSAESTVFLTSNPGVATKTFLRPTADLCRGIWAVCECLGSIWEDKGELDICSHLRRGSLSFFSRSWQANYDPKRLHIACTVQCSTHNVQCTVQI